MNRKRPGSRPDNTGRSKDHQTQHVRLHEWLLKSPAYRSLDCYARALLVELYRFYRPGKNGHIFLSTRAAAEALNASAPTAMRAFHVLADRGFIRARQRGDFDWKARHATTWVLTEFEFADGLASKDFMRWTEPAENQNTVKPGKQTAQPGKQTAQSQKQMDRAIPPSAQPQKQILPNSPQICSPRLAQVSYQVGEQDGERPGNNKRPWTTPTVVEIPSTLATVPPWRRRPA